MAIKRVLVISLVAFMLLVGSAGSTGYVSAQNGEGLTAPDAFGETWTGSNSTAGLTVQNNGTGKGILGIGSNSAGIMGQTNASYKTAVYGINNAAFGIGIYGGTTSSGGIALQGNAAANGTGVKAQSVTGYGVLGKTTGSGATAVYGDAGGNGTGVLGESDTGIGVFGSSADGDGVWGGTNDATHAGVHALNGGTGPGVDSLAGGVGVNALSTLSDGVAGTTWASSKSGVYGLSTMGSGYGVSGFSDNYFGMLAQGPDAWGDDAGDILLGGTLGEIVTWSDVFYAGSHNNIILDLDNNNDNAGACLYIRSGTDTTVQQFCEASGNNATVISAGSQATVVDTASEGQRLMYAVEGTGVWLEDVGTATLVNGELVISFDTAYTQAANLSADYQVFVTAKCDQPVLMYVSSQTATDFTVKGANLDGSPSSCAFNYRVVASRAGYETVRMEQYTPINVEQP